MQSVSASLPRLRLCDQLWRSTPAEIFPTYPTTSGSVVGLKQLKEVYAEAHQEHASAEAKAKWAQAKPFLRFCRDESLTAPVYVRMFLSAHRNLNLI